MTAVPGPPEPRRLLLSSAPERGIGGWAPVLALSSVGLRLMAFLRTGRGNVGNFAGGPPRRSSRASDALSSAALGRFAPENTVNARGAPAPDPLPQAQGSQFNCGQFAA